MATISDMYQRLLHIETSRELSGDIRRIAGQERALITMRLETLKAARGRLRSAKKGFERKNGSIPEYMAEQFRRLHSDVDDAEGGVEAAHKSASEFFANWADYLP